MRSTKRFMRFRRKDINGNSYEFFAWEKTDKAAELRDAGKSLTR